MALLRADIESLRRGRSRVTRSASSPASARSRSTVARELLGDAVLKLVITKGVDVANVTHLGRSPTVAQQVALWWQSPMCTAEAARARGASRTTTSSAGKKPNAPGRRDRPALHPRPRPQDRPRLALVEGTGKRPFVPPDDPRHPNIEPHPMDPCRLSFSDQRVDLEAGRALCPGERVGVYAAQARRARPVDDQAARPRVQRSGSSHAISSSSRGSTPVFTISSADDGSSSRNGATLDSFVVPSATTRSRCARARRCAGRVARSR
jgi:hypothetical protein